MSEKFNQACALIGTIDPEYITASTNTSDIVDASLYDSVVFLFMTGNVCSCSGKMVFTIYEGTATATVSTTLDKTTWSASATGDQNNQYLFEVDTAVMGTNMRYLKGTLVYSGGTGAKVSCAVLGFKPRFHPASDGDLSTVSIINAT